ncbi:carbohydrate ABC transporter permease [Ensifer aridi]|uniref:carbohydrate ABC transporter permease n=1 Tax=Ensifer aridi TaxID=1708715 RepID=UPI000687AF9B|nr:carbohydrate ABC transporter permease [Ensifer aridi]
MRLTTRARLRKCFFWATLLSACAIVVFPVYWMVLASLQTTEEVFAFPPRFISSLRLDNYLAVLRETDLLLWLRNTLFVAVVSTVLALVIGTPAAFALSRFRYRGRTFFSLAVLTTQMIPPLVLIIPLFQIFIYFGITDSLVGLIVGNFTFALPVVVWMLKAMFDGVPQEIEQAARIDGASWFQIMVQVTGPLVLPGIAATTVYAFLDAWDEYMLARTVISSPENWVGSIGIASFVGQYLTPLNLVMAASVLFSLPPILLFLLIQKQFVAGLSAGAVKG